MNYLLDTDVIIDFLKGVEKAKVFLQTYIVHNLYISVVTEAELYAGIRNKKEEKILQDFLQILIILDVNEEIAISGGKIKNKYSKSHGTGLADAIIAATAIENDCTIVSLNKKHFPMTKDILMPYKK